MRRIPFAFLKAAAVVGFSMSALAWEHWHKADDYNAATGTWAGTASAGGSGARSLTQSTSGNRPSAGTAVNGHTPALFDGTNDSLVFDGTATTVAAVGASCFMAVVDLTKLPYSGVTSGAWYDNPAIFGGGSIYYACTVDANGRVYFGHWNTNGEYKVISAYAPSGRCCIVGGYDGANLYLEVNGVAATPVASVNGSYAGSNLRMGVDRTDARWFTGSVLEVAIGKFAYTPTLAASILAYAKTRYSSTLWHPSSLGTLLADYDARNAVGATWTSTMFDPVSGYNAAQDVADTGPTRTAVNASYGGRATLNFATGNLAGSYRLRTAAGLGTAIGSNPSTVIIVGGVTSGAGSGQYVFNTENGRRGVFANVASGFYKMNGPSNDVFTTLSPSVAAVNGFVFEASGAGRFKQNLGAVGTLAGLGLATGTGDYVIGNYHAPSDSFVMRGSIARILVYSGDIGDANLATAHAELKSLYGL